jgi:hypothetical protein
VCRLNDVAFFSHSGKAFTMAQQQQAAGKPAPKTYFGIVRAVNSGDSLSIFENVRQGIPPVREINLSHLQAPRLAHAENPDKVRSQADFFN